MPRIVYIHEFELKSGVTEAETVAFIVSHAIGLDTSSASSDLV